MQKLAAFVCGLGLACTVASGGHVKSQAGGRPDRIIDDKHGFSVMFPKGWFMFDNGDVPAFYNFSPENSIQGNLPVGGASIELLVRDALKDQPSTHPLFAWADQEVGREHGINVGRQDIGGLAAVGASYALRVSFDRKALGTHAPSLHFVIILWQSEKGLFGARLCFIKNDPKGHQYEHLLRQIVESFRST